MLGYSLTAHRQVEYFPFLFRSSYLFAHHDLPFWLWHGEDAARLFHRVGGAVAAATATATTTVAGGGGGGGATAVVGWVLILSFGNFCWFFPATLFARQISFKFNSPHPAQEALPEKLWLYPWHIVRPCIYSISFVILGGGGKWAAVSSLKFEEYYEYK